MPAIQRLFVRDDSSAIHSLSPTMTNLLIALIVLITVGIILVAVLFLLRSHRKSKDGLKAHHSQPQTSSTGSTKTSNHRRLTITATPYSRHSDKAYPYSSNSEKNSLVAGAASPPQSPIPEIRITFPEEEDGAGKRKSGRVVVVRISEAGGVGLEPYHDHNDQLPPYQMARDGKFESLDLERMGGLKELERGVKS